MGSFKNFFDKDKFYFDEQEKMNLQTLSNMSQGKDRKVVMITLPTGERGICVIRADAEDKENFSADDIISGVMVGKNKRIKEIYMWLSKNDLHEKFPFVELAKKPKAKRPVIRKVEAENDV